MHSLLCMVDECIYTIISVLYSVALNYSGPSTPSYDSSPTIALDQLFLVNRTISFSIDGSSLVRTF